MPALRVNSGTANKKTARGAVSAPLGKSNSLLENRALAKMALSCGGHGSNAKIRVSAFERFHLGQDHL
jgi:hypothetical protein